MRDLMNSILIGSLATYLPCWILDDHAQRIVLAIALSILVYGGKLWLAEKVEKRK